MVGRGRSAAWIVDRTWDDRPVGPDESVRVTLRLDPEKILVEVDAPFHDDPSPPEPAGSLDGLWEFEVVELFLLGEDEHYLEIELSPHGHHLVLALHGTRHRVGDPRPAKAACQRNGTRWSGAIEIKAGLLPAGVSAANAYAIHGCGSRRRYLAAHAPGGGEPDFHRLDCFQPIQWTDERDSV